MTILIYRAECSNKTWPTVWLKWISVVKVCALAKVVKVDWLWSAKHFTNNWKSIYERVDLFYLIFQELLRYNIKIYLQEYESGQYPELASLEFHHLHQRSVRLKTEHRVHHSSKWLSVENSLRLVDEHRFHCSTLYHPTSGHQGRNIHPYTHACIAETQFRSHVEPVVCRFYGCLISERSERSRSDIFCVLFIYI